MRREFHSVTCWRFFSTVVLWTAVFIAFLPAKGQHGPKLPPAEKPAAIIVGMQLVGLSPDGSHATSLIHPNQLQILDTTGKAPPLLLEPAPCSIRHYSSSYFSQHGKWVAHICESKDSYLFMVWDAHTGQRVSSFLCSMGGDFAAWNQDETRFAARCNLFTELAVWDVSLSHEIARFNMPHKAAILGMAYNAHGELLVSTDHNRVHFFDSSMREIRSQIFMTTVYWLRSCSDGKNIDGHTLGHLFNHEHEIYLWSENGERPRKLGSGSDDADLWALADDGSLLLIDLSGGLRWFPEKTRIAPVAVFSVKDKRYVRTLAGDLKRAVFTADGRIVAITENSEIWIWECCGIQSSIHDGH